MASQARCRAAREYQGRDPQPTSSSITGRACPMGDGSICGARRSTSHAGWSASGVRSGWWPAAQVYRRPVSGWMLGLTTMDPRHFTSMPEPIDPRA
jgi:hypothetical protein